MLLHEFQAKKLLSSFGVSCPMGGVATNQDEARAVSERLGCRRYAVKGQLMASDRALVDVIRYANSTAEVEAQAQFLIGRSFDIASGRMPQQTVSKVLVEQFIDVVRELYVAIALQQDTGKILMLASAAGGTGLEERAKAEPGLIRSRELTFSGRRLVGDFDGLAAEVAPDAGAALALTELLRNLAAVFVAHDATMIDINPLALSADGQLIAIDAKVTIDDNALSRQPQMESLRFENESALHDHHDLEAQRFRINYLSLGGDIGVAVNGAGLALATNDLLVDCGGAPANFMDIRTTASSLDIAKGFELLLSNPRTRSILVNVHGGGMQRCDTIAEGLGIALRRRPRALPIVIRMAGNNSQFARTVLKNNGISYYEADSMLDAAQTAVALCRGEAA
ncbi:MAG: ATP-grasp domain-containing protein [Filomicrobium sp.]